MVIAERADKYAAEAKKEAKQIQAKAKFQIQKNLHPAVGVLVNAKGVRYYAFVNGNYTEGTPDQLEALLTT
jgi:hypothetical protein